MTRKLGFMQVELYKKIIDEINDYPEPVRSKEIELFHFGESLLHPKIHEMVGYASGMQLKTVLSVNAPHLTASKAEAILQNNPHRIILSLDGYDPDSYRQIRGESADFGKAIENIKSLINIKKHSDYKTEIVIRMIRLNANEEHLDRFKQEWESYGISVEIRPFFPWTEKELVTLGEVRKYPPGMPCPFPWQYLVVQWDGAVVPCCRDYNGVNAVGNAWSDSLKNIWNNSIYEAFRNQHATGAYGLNTFCRNCMDIFYTEPDKTEASENKSPDTIQSLWIQAAKNFSSRSLIISDEDGSVFSYEDSAEIVANLAQRMRNAGLSKGDRICICSPIHAEALFTFWASSLIGAVFVPLDFSLPADALKMIIEEVMPGIIFCDSARVYLLSSMVSIQIVVFDDADNPAVTSSVSFSEWIEDATESFVQSPVEEDDPAVVLYTSGTSGIPKGVVLSHGALCRSGRLMASSYNWQEDDRFMGLAELHTMSGLRNLAVAAVHAGSAIVIADQAVRTNALAVAECIRRNSISVMSTVPGMIRQFNYLKTKIEKKYLTSLRMVLCTGSLLPELVKITFFEYYGIPLLNYYGLTETSGICIGVLPGADIADGSIGVPLDCAVSILHQNGSKAGDDQVGELIISSKNLMTGYYKKPELAEKVLRNGWFYTGDLAFRRQDGSIVLVDRKGDSFKDRRGEVIHPSEIEKTLESHPEVIEAGVCSSIMLDSDRFAAFIVTKDDVSDAERLFFELRSFLLEKLGSYKIPSAFYIVKALPRGTNGKLLRKKLMELIVHNE